MSLTIIMQQLRNKFKPCYTHLTREALRTYHGASRAASIQYTVDLRSDVLTQPTEGMKAAMMNSSMGDDVFDEDKNVHELQDMMAEMFGKEAALLVPSGTMGNLLSIMSHTAHARGLEVLLGDMTHLFLYEQGGLAMIAHVHPRQLQNKADGTFDLDNFDDYVRPSDDAHQPWTAVVSVENTHMNCGGKVLPISFLKELREKTDKHGLKVHVDGARLMNAAVALDVKPKDIMQYADTVSMCFSKGVGTPIGSIIAGDKDFIARSTRLRKALGGGWRQPGMLAKAALYGMQDTVERMKLDHIHAKRVATAVMENHCNTIHIDVEGVHTNLVMVNMVKPGLTAQIFCDRLTRVTEDEAQTIGERVAVKAVAFFPTMARLALYSSISPNDVDFAIRKINYVVKELSQDYSV